MQIILRSHECETETEHAWELNTSRRCVHSEFMSKSQVFVPCPASVSWMTFSTIPHPSLPAKQRVSMERTFERLLQREIIIGIWINPAYKSWHRYFYQLSRKQSSLTFPWEDGSLLYFFTESPNQATRGSSMELGG